MTRREQVWKRAAELLAEALARSTKRDQWNDLLAIAHLQADDEIPRHPFPCQIHSSIAWKTSDSPHADAGRIGIR